MKEIVVRTMTTEDIRAVYDLSKACFSVPWSLESLTKELTNPVAEYQIAEIDHQIIGYGGLWCVVDEGEITNIAVDSKYRKEGIGQAIVEALLKLAQQRKLTVIHLEVRESNVAARRLYEKIGFKSIGTRRKYYNHPVEDAIIMVYQV